MLQNAKKGSNDQVLSEAIYIGEVLRSCGRVDLHSRNAR